MTEARKRRRRILNRPLLNRPVLKGPALKRRVLKLGGSLLSNPRLNAAVDDWLALQPPAQNLVLVGGGQTIEAMRELAERFPLDKAEMHWRCIRLLRATYEVTGELFPEWQLVGECERFVLVAEKPPQPGQWLIAVDTFYSPATQDTAGLPVGWATTTDAIAAYLARTSHADELVLLKSCPIPEGASIERLTEEGIVDRALSTALPQDLKVRIEQLR